MRRKQRKPKVDEHDDSINDDNIIVKDKDGVWRQSDQLLYGFDEEADE